MEHAEIYGLPEIYEIAFSYRDIGKECDFLADVYRMATGQSPTSVLELACGPAVHAREFARRGLGVTALDISPEMAEYAAGKLGAEASVLVADMADFAVPEPVDLAFTLIDSLPYLRTNEQLVSHLGSVRRSLREDGVYVVELRHPADAHPRADRSPMDQWTVERDGLRVTTEWGFEVTYDPLAQTEHVRSRITVQGGGEPRVIESSGTLRPLLPQEFLLLVACAGGWRFLGWWGAFDLSRPLGGSEQDWRMIIGLQRA